MEFVPSLVSALEKGNNVEVRRRAAETLGDKRRVSRDELKGIVPALTKILDEEEDRIVRREIQRALSRIQSQ
jgi:HEAT repeat protein